MPFSGILILGSVKINSPMDGSYINPLTPFPFPKDITSMVADPYSAYPAATSSLPGRRASDSDGSPFEVFLKLCFIAFFKYLLKLFTNPVINYEIIDFMKVI